MKMDMERKRKRENENVLATRLDQALGKGNIAERVEQQQIGKK